MLHPPGFFPTVQRKVAVSVCHKQYGECRGVGTGGARNHQIRSKWSRTIRRKITLKPFNLWMQWEVDFKEKKKILMICKFARNKFPYGKDYVTCPLLSFLHKAKWIGEGPCVAPGACISPLSPQTQIMSYRSGWSDLVVTELEHRKKNPSKNSRNSYFHCREWHWALHQPQ